MRKSISNSLVLFVFICITFQLQAQHRISGRIMENNENDMPLGFATITLSASDSTYMDGVTCDAEGFFEFRNVTSGEYFLTASYIGFVPGTVVLNGLAGSLELGEIFLEEKTNELETVTVTASNVTTKADRLVIFVTDRQKASASNGFELLNTMQLPRLTINPLTDDISLPGEGEIKFCINGVTVTQADIKAVQPKEIIRIEYMDNPGLRYGDADMVINYILKRAVTGGMVSVDTGTAVTTGFSNTQLSAKMNYKKSEFGLNYSLRYRKTDDIWNDKEEIFHFADGNVWTRFSDGLSADFRENYHHFALNYNLLDEKYYLNVTVRHSILDDDKMRRSLQYTSYDPENMTHVYNGTITKQQLPSVDIYYSRSLKNNQTLIFNAVGTYIGSEINQKYEEKKENQRIADILSDVDGKKYSVIGEGMYEKLFENSQRVTAGLKYTQAFADNEYTGTENGRTKMNQHDTYGYVEYAGKKGAFSYIGGVGLSCSWARQRGEEQYSYYTFRPKITFQYNLAGNTFLRLKGEIYNTTPSLSELSAVDQYIDTLQSMRGNPSLTPNLNYLTELTFGWKKGVYGLNFYTSYQYSPEPVMESVIRENNKFVETYDNQKKWQKVNSELTLSAGPVKDILMVSLTGGVNHYISDGNTYYHEYTNFYYRAQVMGMYKKLTAVFQINSAYDRFSGETLYGGENVHLFMVSYHAGPVKVGVGVIQPFAENYKRYSENRNEYRSYKSESFANNFSRLCILNVAWNFDFGRKAESGSKRIYNSDSDPGIMLTR